MKMDSFFGDNAEIDMDELREGAATARLLTVMSATSYEALLRLKARKDLPLPVRLAACEGVAEFTERTGAGKRTWPMRRWVDEALRSMMDEAERRTP